MNNGVIISYTKGNERYVYLDMPTLLFISKVMDDENIRTMVMDEIFVYRVALYDYVKDFFTTRNLPPSLITSKHLKDMARGIRQLFYNIHNGKDDIEPLVGSVNAWLNCIIESDNIDIIAKDYGDSEKVKGILNQLSDSRYTTIFYVFNYDLWISNYPLNIYHIHI